MPRLVDYVVLVGYDFDRSSGGESQGRIVQRFPTKSWDDYPYEFHLEAFCQPCGWQLVQNRLPPTFFVAYLTDVVGNPYFAACLTFHEAVTPQQLNAAERLALLNSSTSGSGSHHRRTATQVSHMVNGSVHHLRLAPPKASPTTGSLHSSESAGSYEVQGQLFGRTRASSTGLNMQNFDRGDPNLIRPAELYAPKCLVLLARHNHFDVLKVGFVLWNSFVDGARFLHASHCNIFFGRICSQNSLSVLYTVFADSLRQYSLEHIIATLLGAIDVPPPGGPRISFSLGAGDRQTIQPAHCITIPVTRNYVALLFRHLGIHNVILLFSAILSDQKVLLCSRSLNRLTESCQALTAILYPLKYGYVLSVL
ncbi:Myotubularin protein 5 [Fasciola gigantica]|uniref:Myotubularin protein 5 n=1 Tax=Fasciola gigantica TaxID=46835 RepID=A0A504YGL5_FASGI|nr:Myotubularin protein 5 [Fasciola gigantica]